MALFVLSSLHWKQCLFIYNYLSWKHARVMSFVQLVWVYAKSLLQSFSSCKKNNTDDHFIDWLVTLLVHLEKKTKKITKTKWKKFEKLANHEYLRKLVSGLTVLTWNLSNLCYRLWKSYGNNENLLLKNVLSFILFV